jgi:hypothetical protein
LQHARVLPPDFSSFSITAPRRCYLAATRRCFIIVIVEQDAVGGAVQVVKLTGLQGPEEAQQAQKTQSHRQWNEKDQRVHRSGPVGVGAVTGARR